MSVLKSLSKLSRNPSRRAEARDYFKLHVDEILNEFPKTVTNSDGAQILDCLLNSIPASLSANTIRSKVSDTTLSRLRCEPTGLRLCNELVSRLCLELPKVPQADVLRLADQCVNSIVHDEDVNMIWRDVLPECLAVLAKADKVVHCGTEMSTEDYKVQCIRTLCQCRWQEKSIVQLAAMFRDVRLDRDEHSQVVTKLCTMMIDLPPETVPPLLHQLLDLCSNRHLEIVLAYLSQYFNLRLYGKLRNSLQDSDSTYMDVEDFGGHTVNELRECVSTCLYHALQSSEQLCKTLKVWPRSQLLRKPFLFEATLSLADSPAYGATCLAVARAAITQSCTDEQKCGESAWIRSVLKQEIDVPHLLKVITAESQNSKNMTTVGLINLAFSLLTTSPALGRERLAFQCATHAKHILVRLIKSQPATAQHVLGMLADRLLENSYAQKQCADCLQVLCRLTPNSIQDSQLCSILENCQALGDDYRSSAAVYDAVHPVLSFKNRVRDTLVMICRKGLFSRDCSSRCLAVWGFLTLLRHMRLPMGSGTNSEGDGACSDQYSVNSYLTQISVSVHTTQAGASVSNVRNEAVCREVVSILRRCFTQDAAVKQLFYTNIYQCSQDKTSSHTPILELLLEHFTRYTSVETGLALDKCVQITPTGAVLVEPVGYLLLSVQQFLQMADEDETSSEDILSTQEDEGSTTRHFKQKLRAHMDRLCNVYSKMKMRDFDMEDEHGLTDLTPESKAKSLKIQQALQVYEALVAYVAMQWRLDSEDPASKLCGLFTVYSQLLDNAKAPSKVAKKAKKTANDTTQKNQKAPTQKSQPSKSQGKAPKKLSSMIKGKAAPFKQLPCLWDLAVCCRMLELLYSEEVPWSTSEQRAQLRTRRDLHVLALSCVQSVLDNETRMSRTALVRHVTRMATVLYTRCVARFQDMCDFHEPAALASVDLFRECLSLAFNPTNGFKIAPFLEQITCQAEEGVDACLAAILESVWTGLQQLDSEQEADAQQGAASRKLTAALVHLASLALDKQRGPSCARLHTVVGKLEQHVRTARIDSTALVPALLAARARFTQDCRLLDDLIVKLTASLGKIMEEESIEADCDTFPGMEDASVHAAFGHACAHVTAHCTHIEYVLARAKEFNAALRCMTQVQAEKIEHELIQMDKAAVIQLALAGGRVTRLASLCCAVGTGSDKILTAAVRLYTALTALVVRLTKTSAAHVHTIRLERALSVCGRPLSSALDALISHVESSPGRGRDKVLRDTRVVPRLVFAAEQFSRNVVLLGKRTKINLQQYISLGTARDFRIKADVVAEALRGQVMEVDEIETPEPHDNLDIKDLEDTSTVVLSPAASVEEVQVDEVESEEEARPGDKRRRRTSH